MACPSKGFESSLLPHLGFEVLRSIFQSQKTQGLCVVDFMTLSDERRSRSKIFLLFDTGKRTLLSKFEGLARSKILGISQTNFCHCNQ